MDNGELGVIYKCIGVMFKQGDICKVKSWQGARKTIDMRCMMHLKLLLPAFPRLVVPILVATGVAPSLLQSRADPLWDNPWSGQQNGAAHPSAWSGRGRLQIAKGSESGCNGTDNFQASPIPSRLCGGPVSGRFYQASQGCFNMIILPKDARSMVMQRRQRGNLYGQPMATRLEKYADDATASHSLKDGRLHELAWAAARGVSRAVGLNALGSVHANVWQHSRLQRI